MYYPNNGYNTNYFQNGYNYPNSIVPRYEILHVNSRKDVDSIPMQANSEALVMDDNNPLIYVVKVDALGNKNVSAFTVSPYSPEPEISISELAKRISALEERINGKSNVNSTVQSETV